MLQSAHDHPRRKANFVRKTLDSGLAEITRQFAEQADKANLEEVFFRATTDAGKGESK